MKMLPDYARVLRDREEKWACPGEEWFPAM